MQDNVESRSPMFAFGMAAAGVAMVLASAALVLTLTGAGGGGAAVAATDASGPERGTTRVEVALNEWGIDMPREVPPGKLVFEIANNGSIEHDFAFEGLDGRSPRIRAGETFTLTVDDVEPGTYEITCTVEGHRDSGMHTTLVVLNDDGSTPSSHGGHGGDETDWEALDTAMVESIMAYPAATEGIGNTILEPVVLEDGTKEFELTTKIVEWEVEPGKLVEAWTYNGIVPGPQIRVDLGDKLRIVVHNELPMGTDIHWHGVSTPNNMDGVAPLTQPLIKSGETFVYEFEAEEPAVGMYHAHHHAQMQVVNGMFAAFIIDEVPLPLGSTISGIEIPADLELAAEMPMVLNDAGNIGFSLNGKSFPATEPLVVDEGDWFVVHYYNEGLTDHPMHLHQFEQLVYAKDGIPLDQPYFADTINIAPGERYSVLVQADRAGVWVWHCHILTHVEREEGMFGMVTAVIVNEV